MIILQWRSNHNTPCLQAVITCEPEEGPHNNLLITQLINRMVNGKRLSQVFVTIELEQKKCNSSLICIKKQELNAYIYETSNEDRDGARNIDNYQKIGIVSSGDMEGKLVNKTIAINFTTGNSFFYFAIQDNGFCTIITRMIIYHHKICPAQKLNLISYPETNAANRSISVAASCVENAQPKKRGVFPMVTCLPEGTWSPIRKGPPCICAQGYYRANGGCNRKLNLS